MDDTVHVGVLYLMHSTGRGYSTANVMAQQRSQLQRDVLALYRAFMRACDGKPAATREHVRQMFREETARVSKTNTVHMEYLMRRAKRQLFYLRSADRVSKF